MAKLESYSNLAKLQEDLLKKNFSFGQDLALSVYARSSGLSVKSSFKQTSDEHKSISTFGSTYFQYKYSNLSLKQEIGSNSLSKTTFEYTPENLQQLKLKAELESNAEENLQKNTLSAEYTHDKLKGKLAFTDDSSLRLSSVVGNGKYGGGLDLTLDPSNFRFTAYNAAIWFFQQDLRVVFKHISTNKKEYTLGNLAASFYYNLRADLQTAALVTYNQKNVGVSAVVQKKLEEGRVVKARVNETGNVGVALRTKVSEGVTVVTAAQFDVLDASRSLSFGLRLKINQ